ncbi:MAG: EAL domain-containing protein [Sulfurimonadaceae bacterium]|jgi:diguanylate cyclase (GGDEF)-like protein/PAS domain S-box-containing protein|nr:EAL domain-containing protein [Sulfurimonadaceae bacterium]
MLIKNTDLPIIDYVSLIKINEITNKHVHLSCSDLDGNITYITDAYLQFTGYTREEVMGKNHSLFKHPNVDNDFIKNLWKTITQDKVWVGELENINKAGVSHWVKTMIEPLFDANGLKVGYCSIREDISDRKSLEEFSKIDIISQLYNRRHFNEIYNQELFFAKENQSSLGLLLCDIDSFEAFNLSYGYQQGDMLLFSLANVLRKLPFMKKHFLFRLGGGEFAILIKEIDTEELNTYAKILQESIYTLQIPHVSNIVSNIVTLSIGGASVCLDHGIYVYSDIYNIADKNLFLAKKSGRNTIKVTSHLAKLSEPNEIDPTTQLPTRLKLNHDLNNLEKEAMLILLYINDFSHYHEHYGNEFIDKLLVQKAKVLRQHFISEDVSIYRLNINEFAILVTHESKFRYFFSLLEHSILTSRICCDIDNPDSQEVAISYTAGIAYGKEQILRKANHALQKAFISTKNFCIYEENLTQNKVKKDHIRQLNIYKKALEDGNIIPYFQPVIDAKTEKIVKYEALARIIDTEGNIVPPYLFLDIAKEDKTFENFTRQLLQKVFAIVSKNEMEFSVNLTYENATSPELIAYIKNRLDKYGGEKITFEIIESEEIVDYPKLNRFIKEVKNYGCKIAIDDFGSGYSNFTNLIKLDIDYIKIDGTIIEKLHLDKNVESMTKSLISFAKETGIQTIAEYVSSEEIANKVKELNVDLLQGFYYGKPLDPSAYKLIV